MSFHSYTVGSKPNPATNVLFVTRGPTQNGSPAQTSQFEANSVTYPNLSAATITFNDQRTFDSMPELTFMMAHEVGHTFRLDDCYPACNGVSVMGAQLCDANGNGCVQAPTPCDNAKVNQYGYSTPTPTPTPTPGPTPINFCNGVTCSNGCVPKNQNGTCPLVTPEIPLLLLSIPPDTPIVVDISGNNFSLTDNSVA